MTNAIPETSLKQLFTEARSYHAWTDAPVSDGELQQLYDLLKWGPTAVNTNPARFLFLTTEAAKQRLVPMLMDSNVEQVKAAPITLVVAQDRRFHDRVAELFPAYDATSYFEENKDLREETGLRNSSLQGAYAVLAARALGLDVCPMSGFDTAALDAEFFAGTNWHANFVMTIGHGDAAGLHPRGPRLPFEEACKII